MNQTTRHGSLEGRVAVVTGSGRNIGKAIAMRLAAEGAAVVVNARSSQAQVDEVVEEIKMLGGQAVACLADVTQPKDVKRMTDLAVSEFGGLDILVNNAAVRREAKLDTITLGAWREILAIILDGAFLCAQAAAPHMIVRGRGAIVNIGGMTGSSGASHRVHVVTGKAGLIGLTKSLAWDLAEHRITANLVSPGMVETARDTATVAAKPKHHEIHKPLLERRGSPEEIASVVQMLCGPDGQFVTGQVVHVNGGAYLN